MIVTREFIMPDSHPVLLGHFPDDPIVPGVILMAWCEQLAADFAQTPVITHSWPRVKFFHPLKPGQTCRITIESDSGTQASFRVQTDSELVASGTFEWRAVSP